MILITTCFATVTPESAEHGDYADQGIISEDSPTPFRDLVAMLKGGESSCGPARGETFEWVTQDQGGNARLHRTGRTDRTHIPLQPQQPCAQSQVLAHGVSRGWFDQRGLTMAKRWYHWFAAPHDVAACPRATPAMRAAAWARVQRNHPPLLGV